MVLRLLWAKILSLTNTPRSAGGGRSKTVLFAIFGAVIWFAIFFGAKWFLGKCVEVEPIGELIVEKMLDLTLLIIFSILVFSNVITAFSTLYLSEDLELLMSHPIPPNTLYTARFIETAALSAWMPLVFGMPVFVAVGVIYRVDLFFYAAVAVVLFPLMVIAAAVAVPITLLLTNLLPAHRTRDVFVFMGVLLFVVLFIVFRAINPEELFNPDQFDNTMELFASLQTSSSLYSPSNWALVALRPWLRNESGVEWGQLASLYLSAGGLYFVGAWTFRQWHFPGYSKAQEGRHEGSGLERVAGFFRRRSASDREAAKRAIDLLSRRKRSLSPVEELVRKDAKIFLRDTAQWSQLLLLGALAAIYLLNFRYTRVLGETGVIGPSGLFLMNIGLCGFVIAAVGMRFLFPAVSLEGRSFWLIRCSPNSLRGFLLAKLIAGGLPLLIISELLAALSNIMIGISWELTVGAVFTVLALNVGVSGLGVGIGAIYPRFNLDNAAKIATGFGGMLYMMCALGLVVLVSALTMPAAWYGNIYLRTGGSFGSRELTIALSTAIASLVIPVVVGFVALRIGERSLERR